jgi:uroporphyrinogen decarboxylase
VHKALIEGTSGGMRMSMDQYLSFAVECQDDFNEIKKRMVTGIGRYPTGWREIHLPRWKNREHPLILGRNCSTAGFYWRCREWMGTENLSLAFFEQPELLHDMMEFIADFIIEVSKPILKETDVDYVMLAEDMSMKSGPLLSPAHYREFIFPHMRRLVDFFKSNGVRYVMVDTDGNCEALLPTLMDVGVDGIWPLERVAGMDPIRIRKEYGKDLRLTGGVDKIEIAKGPDAIDRHLAHMVPLIEEGGFIPTIDHMMSPEISYQDFLYYIKRKNDLLCGKF